MDAARCAPRTVLPEILGLGLTRAPIDQRRIHQHGGGREQREEPLALVLCHTPRMPVDVLTEILIERPVAVVSAFAGDPSRAPEWYANIRSVEWQTAPPLVVGSRMAFVAHFLGRRLAYTYEVRELVPDERLVMSTSEGPFPMETTYTWRDEDGNTRMTLRNRGEPTGFSVVVAPLMAMLMRRANLADLAKLKGVLEAR